MYGTTLWDYSSCTSVLSSIAANKSTSGARHDESTHVVRTQVFFQDDTKGGAATKAVAANAALVADAVRCLPLPVSLMPPYAVVVGRESFSVTEESEVEDFTTFLTRPCVSINKVGNVTFDC